MDGIHDLGGMTGFGRVEVEPNEPVFHERWEARAFALNGIGIRAIKAYNVHEYRHAVERLAPAHYLAAPYYERWFTAIASLMVEKGVVSHAELERRAGGHFPLAQAPVFADACEVKVTNQPRFSQGDRVITRDIHPAGHTRMPRYVRGKVGTIVRCAPAFEFPDLAGHAMTAHVEPTYLVEFAAADLWPNAGDAQQSVVIDLWESYLDAAS